MEPWKSPCECKIPNGGFCERHGVKKFARLVTLCQTNKKYWDAWEASRGPEQKQTPATIRRNQKKKLWGDQLEAAFTSVGITKERVSKLLGRPCKCPERKEMLNRLHLWAKRVLGGDVEDADVYFEQIEKDHQERHQ